MNIFLGRWRRDSSRIAVSDDVVLDATVKVLAKNPNATLADVGRRARVNERQMRERFTSLDDLIDMAVMRGARRIARSAFLEDGTPAEQIALLVARLWDDQYPVAAFTLRGVHGPLRPKIDTTLEPLRALTADAVARGAVEGTLRSDTPAETAAWLIEHTTVICLEHAARTGMNATEGRDLAMRQALAAAGLSWDAANDVVRSVRTSLR